jgi:hypothetical protein
MSDPVRQIADAVLYEGYILWPYRRSATKNRHRWTFGGVYPRAHSEAHPDDRWTMQTQCLVEADGPATVAVSIRFLQVVERRLVAETEHGRRRVDELFVAGERHLAWEEAREREVAVATLQLSGAAETTERPVEFAAGEDREELREGNGSLAGTVERAWGSLSGWVRAAAAPVDRGLHRVTVTIGNETPWGGGAREELMRRSLCSTHTILHAEGGELVSMTDPPPELAAPAHACSHEGTWPVLVGKPGDRRTVLSSAIILEDYPRIAPESPGDLFDGGEIDQLLTLSILSLTDEEKAEMRDSDPRAREILERTESLSEAEMMRLNGAIREFGMQRR